MNVRHYNGYNGEIQLLQLTILDFKEEAGHIH